jgi:hypothetical protein
MEPFTDSVSFHTQADEIVGAEVVESLVTGQRHSFIVEKIGRRVQPGSNTGARGQHPENAQAIFQFS